MTGRPLAAALAGLGLVTVVIAVTAAGAVRVLRRRYVVVAVAGGSMAPALRDGDRVLVRRADGRRCRTGDVVVLQAPGSPDWRQPPPAPRSLRGPWHVKRVAAVAGEPLPEPAARACGQPAGSPVPADRMVVIGDAPASYDSRDWGFLPADRVLGVVLRDLPGRVSTEGQPER